MRWLPAGSFDPTFIGLACALPGGGALAVGYVGRYANEVRPAAFRWVAGRWEQVSPADGAAAPGGPMGATLALATGHVLCAGGRKPGHPAPTTLADVQAWDPPAGKWSARAALPEPREGFTATLLEDGSVLLTGGKGSLPGRSDARVLRYRPDADRWSSETDLPEPRVNHLAARLADGTVLVAGGTSPAGHQAGAGRGAFRYQPAATGWEAAGELSQARKAHALLALGDGRAAVLGGWAGRVGELDGIEVFDPATGGWSLGGVLLERRKDLAAARLPDGRVLVTGGSFDREDSVVVRATTEVWDPRTGLSTAGPTMLRPRRGHQLLSLDDGRLLAVGGLSTRTPDDALTEVLAP